MVNVVELRPHLFRIDLGRFQSYLWRDPGAVTLIDTGEPGSAPAIAAALAELGLHPADVRTVVLTHWHDDHTGSAADIRAWSDHVTVVAHAAEAPVISGAAEGAPPDFTDFERELHARVAAGLPPAAPVPVDREVHDGDVLDFAGGARVIGTPGHTDGSIALFLPEHGVLLTGDIAAEHEGAVIPGVFNVDRPLAAESFRRLSTVDAEVACFGHGAPVLRDAGARLRAAAA